MGGSHSRHQVLAMPGQMLDEGLENDIDVEPFQEEPLEQESEEPIETPPMEEEEPREEPLVDEKPEEAPEEETPLSGGFSPLSPVPCWGKTVQHGRMLGSTQDLPSLPGFGSRED